MADLNSKNSAMKTERSGAYRRQAPPAPEKPLIEQVPADKRALMRNNYFWMCVAGAMIVIGFILMAGKGSGFDAFNPDIFSTRRIVVGPFITFLGFILMGIAIIIKPSEKLLPKFRSNKEKQPAEKE